MGGYHHAKARTHFVRSREVPRDMGRQGGWSDNHLQISHRISDACVMPGSRAPIPSKGKQRFWAYSGERSIEITTAVIKEAIYHTKNNPNSIKGPTTILGCHQRTHLLYWEQPKWPRYWPRRGYGPLEKREMELLVIMESLG